MRDSREIRYYASIPKILLLLIGSGVFVVLGYGMRSSGANAVIAWFAMVFFGFCALVALAVLVLAVVVRQPLLAIDSTGITSRQPLIPDPVRLSSFENRDGSGLYAVASYSWRMAPAPVRDSALVGQRTTTVWCDAA